MRWCTRILVLLALVLAVYEGVLLFSFDAEQLQARVVPAIPAQFLQYSLEERNTLRDFAESLKPLPKDIFDLLSPDQLGRKRLFSADPLQDSRKTLGSSSSDL